MKGIKWLNAHFEEAFMVILLAMMAAVMTIQVILRYVMNQPLAWAEEFCRFCQVWSTFVSIGYCTQRRLMLQVDALTRVLPKALQGVNELFIRGCILAVYVFFLYQSVGIVSQAFGSKQVSPAMGLPMYILYSITTVGFALGVLREIQDVFRYFREQKLEKQKGGS